MCKLLASLSPMQRFATRAVPRDDSVDDADVPSGKACSLNQDDEWLVTICGLTSTGLTLVWTTVVTGVEIICNSECGVRGYHDLLLTNRNSGNALAYLLFTPTGLQRVSKPVSLA